MEFIVFIGIIIGVCVVGKKIYDDEQYKKALNDAEWRKRMHQQNMENEKFQFEQDMKKVMDNEYHEAIAIAEKFKKEAELILFEQKCLIAASNIKFDVKSFTDFEMDNIDGVEFYSKKRKDEYDFLIKSINDEKYINLHTEIKEYAIKMVEDLIILSLKETQFGDNMIGKALDLSVIYSNLCIIIAAKNTDKYDDLLNNLKKYLEVVFTKGLVYIRQLDYGKFEMPLDDSNEMKYIQQHEKEIKKEIQENLLHITDNENSDFIGMQRVFNLEFLKKMAMLMWYYAKKKPFDSDNFYEACGFFDEFTGTEYPISERIIAEIYAKNQMGGFELVRQDIDKFNHAILKGKALYQKYIVSALAWMELYDFELSVLKNIVNAKGTITESMQERLSFLSNGGTTNIKIYDTIPTNELFYYDSSSCEWTPKEYDIFFKKMAMKSIMPKYSLSVNIWRKTLPLMSGQKISNNIIYEEFKKMIQDFDGEVMCRKVKAKAVDLDNMIYNEAILFKFNSERNRCMSMLFSSEKFGKNLNLVIITMFTPEDNLNSEDMKKYTLSIQKSMYVESFRESILQSLDEILKEKKQVYENEPETYKKIFFD